MFNCPQLITAVLLLIFHQYSVHASCSSEVELGLKDETIADSQLSASSVRSIGYEPYEARIQDSSTSCWQPLSKDYSWWMVDLLAHTFITQLEMEGAPGTNNRIKTFSIDYSSNGETDNFTTYFQSDGSEVMDGNKDDVSSVTVVLDTPIFTRFLKVNSESHQTRPSLRIELTGCYNTISSCSDWAIQGATEDGRYWVDSGITSSGGRPDFTFCADAYGTGLEDCLTVMGVALGNVSDAQMTASTETTQYEAMEARLGSSGSWVPSTQDTNQYLQIDFLSSVYIVGVETEGDIDTYELQYGDDVSSLTTVQEDPSQVAIYTTSGNKQFIGQTLEYLSSPVSARYVRIVPKTWTSSISLRVELYGCGYSAPASSVDLSSNVVTGLCDSNTVSEWVQSGTTSTYCAQITNQINLDCINALGVHNSQIPDENINVTSSLSSQYDGSHARYNDEYGWVAGVNDDEQNILIDTAGLPIVTKILVQGSPVNSDRVLTFILRKSTDNIDFVTYKENDIIVTFDGPPAGGEVMYELAEPFNTRYVMFAPKTWSGNIAMRVEVFGCYDAVKESKATISNSGVGYGWYSSNNILRYYYEKFESSGTLINFPKIEFESLSASTEGSGTSSAAYGDYRVYSQNGAWMATATSNQWLQVNLGVVTLVSKIDFTGLDSSNTVETYEVYYGNDGVNFYPYEVRGETVVIDGPQESFGIVTEIFSTVLMCQYVRIYPKTWAGAYPAATIRLIGETVEASDCDAWYNDGHTDPGYFPINKNGESYVAYCPFGVAENFPTCQSYLDAGFTKTGYYQIDPDGSAGGVSFEIYCDFDSVKNGAILSTVEHNQQGQTYLELQTSTYAGPGAYDVDILYGGFASAAEVNVMASAAYKCSQYIHYRCKRTKIWDSTDDDQYTWWEASDGSQMTNWGGVETGGSGCVCGQYGKCRGGSSLKCHCDEENDRFLTDGGYIIDNTKLPVNRLSIGDHGESGEMAYYRVGPLICHEPGTADFPIATSCLDAFNSGYSTNGYYVIDSDGVEGPLDFVLVYCMFDEIENAVVTTIGHDTQDWREVAGYSGNGGFARDIHYDHIDTKDQIVAIVDGATSCRQLFNYRSFSSTRIVLHSKTWWTNRDYSKTSYLGDPSVSRLCPCAMYGQCYDPSQDCNSNSALDLMMEDGGWLTFKDDLPVMQLFLGDTGGSKYAHYELGELWCAEETSTILTGCYEMKLNGDSGSGYYLIDPDGSGGNDPFVVYCDLDYNSTHAEMVLSHDSENRTQVTDHSAEGEYQKMITYDGMMYNQLLSLFDVNQTEVSMGCRQTISYECYNSRLLEGNFTWWVSRTGQIKRFWGGSEEEGSCACGEDDSCTVSGDTCHCASQQSTWLEDVGDLMDWFTEYLPVMQLRIGDTGSEGVSEGYFTLGKLYCYIGPGSYMVYSEGSI